MHCVILMYIFRKMVVQKYTTEDVVGKQGILNEKNIGEIGEMRKS